MLTAALLLAAVLAVALALALARAAGRPFPPMPPTFDEHTRTALALLQPDHPDLPDDDPELAAVVDALLADLFPTVPQEDR